MKNNRDFTLEDIKHVIDTSVQESERRIKKELTGVIDTKIDNLRGEFNDKLDAEINKLAKTTSDGFDRIEGKLDLYQVEMRMEFRKMNDRHGSDRRNHNARLEILEEKVL